MQLFYQPGIQEGVNHLDPEESRHCIKVLRKKQHDLIELVDGKGNFYQGIITETNPKRTCFQIVEQQQEAARIAALEAQVAELSGKMNGAERFLRLRST